MEEMGTEEREERIDIHNQYVEYVPAVEWIGNHIDIYGRGGLMLNTSGLWKIDYLFYMMWTP